ncbi:MAG TPA: signal recognition particle-docking protein FtsY [Firmicutes bacterium]|jgi:fused signal recognition particle receptor|nr:signal recognition particle-docking protein FtsY [Bacillota bacterium]
MLDQFKKGLQKTREALKNRFENLFGVNELDEEFYDELEEILVSADVGVKTTEKIISLLRERAKKEKARERSAARKMLKDLLIEMLDDNHRSSLATAASPPTVYLILGVNGVGKTTAIAKIAYQYSRKGKKVLLAAGDTFRAAAIDQLDEWSRAVGAGIIKHQEGGDPSAVIFDAVNAAKSRGVDLLLCDTAGRLHTKANLLDEMKKIYRVIQKSLGEAPHETLLVVDATTGQNAIAQARLFQEVVPISGLILTKLDGTARGGIVLAVKDITGIPLKLLGVGEKKEDLEPFNAVEFVEALLA